MNSVSLQCAISRLPALLASPVYSAIALIVMICAVYWPVTTFDFVRWDDQINVYENPHLNPPSWSDVRHFWTSSKLETTQPNLPVYYVYRPVVYTVWAAVASFAGLSTPMLSTEAETYHLNPHIFHATNLIFHLLNSLLVLALLRRLCQNPIAAFTGAALFALHPIQVETVAWVTGLNDLLCVFFSLGATWFYVRHAEVEGATRWRHYLVAMVFFVLTLLSKPVAVVLPLMLLIVDRYFLKRRWQQSTQSLLPWLIPAVGAILITRLAEPEAGRIFSPLWARPLIALDALAFYLSKFVYPIWLGPDYGRTPRAILENGWAYFTWIGPVALFTVAWFYRRRHPWLLASVLLFVVALLPVLGLVPFRYQNHSTVADRYMYLPFLAVALLATCALASSQKSRAPQSVVAALAIISILLCAGLSTRQVRFWKSNATLFAHVRDVHPVSWVAHANYGSYLLHVGRFDDAARSFELALREDPDYFPLYTDLAFALAQQGKYEAAAKVYRQALQKRPDSAAALAGLGNVFDKQGNLGEAMKLYRRALEADPSSPEVLYNLGHALYRSEKAREAIELFQRALQYNPDDAQTHNGLALALAKTGESTQAAAHWEKAISIDPRFAEAHVNLGVLRAQQGQLDAAFSHWQTALRAAPDNAEAHYYIGLVSASEGRTEEAASHFQKVIQLQPHHVGAKSALASLNAKTRPAPAGKQ